MFAYCGNNPVDRFDPTGQSWWTDFWQYAKDWLEEEREEAASNPDTTTTVGGTAAAGFGVVGSVSAGYTSDTKGNVGIMFTFSGGGGFPNAGVGFFKSVNNAPTIFHQGGWGTAVGASGGPGTFAIGGDYNTLIDLDNNCAYHGSTVSATLGFYPTIVEVHGEVGRTWVCGWNLYDIGIGIADFMLGN